MPATSSDAPTSTESDTSPDPADSTAPSDSGASTPGPAPHLEREGQPVDGAAQAPGGGAFPFLSLILCLVLAWGFGALLEMPTRQILLEYALPIFLITQILRRAMLWLRRTDRWSQGVERFRATVDQYGGHYYGTVTFLTFLELEFRELQKLWLQSPDAWAVISSLSFERVFYFGIDSVINAVKATFWPVQWFRNYGSDAWLLIALTWLLYRAAVLMLKPWLPERKEGGGFLRVFVTFGDEAEREIEGLESELKALEQSLPSGDTAPFDGAAKAGGSTP